MRSPSLIVAAIYLDWILAGEDDDDDDDEGWIFCEHFCSVSGTGPRLVAPTITDDLKLHFYFGTLGHGKRNVCKIRRLFSLSTSGGNDASPFLYIYNPVPVARMSTPSI